ncbi:hypothetical protein GIS00_20180 [Nakamurella sp. YIM 132087]|uniref:YCII-related domain-containing protein n=1 Tax=Nakamurella alba TaxID=2665158 RepID=A0A7K1FQ47_9ACTN|nr:YciI family protein [Nakamurella alba]MTD16261.1 hypothetical protein [Nakamurella alba]
MTTELLEEPEMPKYLLSIVEAEEPYAEGGGASFDEIMAMHHSFSQAVADAGASIVGGEALLPVATATFFRGTRTDDVRTVDNPLPEAKEILGGYYLIEAADESVAAELAKVCPAPFGYIEMRPIWDFSEQQ